MKLQEVQSAMEMQFSRDIGDGTVEIKPFESSVVLDGGNWSLIVHSNDAVSIKLPMNDVKYFDDDPYLFLENVIGPEVEESLAMLDRDLSGAIVDGLRRSLDSWNQVLADKIKAIGV